jgi:hypothetical protein
MYGEQQTKGSFLSDESFYGKVKEKAGYLIRLPIVIVC